MELTVAYKFAYIAATPYGNSTPLTDFFGWSYVNILIIRNSRNKHK